MKTDLSTYHQQAAGYRADIDGLRALAVLSVVLYHALPLWMPGGFVGVDVFFVISGFLITQLIVAQLKSARFSFIDFYARRVKRIFPALLLVLAATYACGWWVMLADEFSQLGGHVAGGAGFIANLVLWHEAGYFDTASSAKPLLHLWSLGIEEQFYLLWPWLLWAAVRRGWPLLPLIAGLALCSFAINIVTIADDRVAAFYAPQARCWELFAGALLACGTRNGQFPARLRGASLLGLALLIASLYFIDDSRAFPGGWALLPVTATVMLIGAGPQACINRVLLASPALVAIGLISYPLYLWHWPLLSFARIIGSQPPSAALGCLAMAVAMVLAWLTYRLLEVPLRFRLRGAVVTPVLLAAMIAMGVLGGITMASGGLPFRAMVARNAANSALLEWDLSHTPACDRAWVASMNFCTGVGDVAHPRIALLGDSTANSLAPGLAAWAGATGQSFVHVGGYACPPVRGLQSHPDWKHGPDCLAGMRHALEQVAATPSIEVVVLGLFARDLHDWGLPGVALNAPMDARFTAFKAMFDADIATLRAAGKRVVVSYDMPFARTHARDCFPRPLSVLLADGESRCFAPEASLRERQPYLGLFDEHFAGREDVCVFRQSELLLRDGRLHFADEQGRLLMRDDHHLSTHGSARMAELLVERCHAAFTTPGAHAARAP